VDAVEEEEELKAKSVCWMVRFDLYHISPADHPRGLGDMLGQLNLHSPLLDGRILFQRADRNKVVQRPRDLGR
jgi:hypothetical protein